MDDVIVIGGRGRRTDVLRRGWLAGGWRLRCWNPICARAGNCGSPARAGANVTNACEPREFLDGVMRNPKFLKSALYAFPPSATTAFFESLGVPLKTERGNRVFPVSDRADDVADALERRAREGGVRFLCRRALAVAQNQAA